MLRIGLLGAARVTSMAMIEPAARRRDVDIVAIAAARPGHAEVFARANDIPRFYDHYEDLIADREIDLIYNALPPHNHAKYSIQALQAGKHVLCEKPLALTAAQARAMVAASRSHDRRLIEAFHDRYHPVFAYLIDLVASRRLGSIRALKAVFNHTIPRDPQEFRHKRHFGGGALDLGCYPIHWCRSLLNEEPVIETAQCAMTMDGVDEATTAWLNFPCGVTAEIETHMTPLMEHARKVRNFRRARQGHHDQ